MSTLKTEFTKPLSFNKICIVGVGLIGGSLGMAIRKRRLAKWVIGVVRHDETAKKAIQLGALDVATKDLKVAVKDADLVILSGPVSVITSQLKVLPKLLKEKTIVIDVGSSKALIDRTAKKYLRKKFIGCHPMAGSEKRGVEFSEADLFKGSLCFITSQNASVESFWKALGAKPVRISSSSHDAWVANASHLPHALSFSLFQNVSCQYPYNPSLKGLGRLAESRGELWADIFLSNRTPVLSALGQFKKSLGHFEKKLRLGNKSDLLTFIRNANKKANHCH